MSTLDFLARANPDYVDSLYREYERDPRGVDKRWALVFAEELVAGRVGAAPADGVPDLVHSYRELGHLVADLDPLGHSPQSHPLLRLEGFGFSEADLGRIVQPGSFRGLDAAPLRDLLQALRETYCRTLGVEHLDIRDKEQRDWLEERMEPCRNRPGLSSTQRTRLLEELVAAEAFEQLVRSRYASQRHFSLAGG